MGEAGDQGDAEYILDSRVRIVWPNGSQSLTDWPNTAWYRGLPRGYHHGIMDDSQETALADNKCTDLEQCSFSGFTDGSFPHHESSCHPKTVSAGTGIRQSRCE